MHTLMSYCLNMIVLIRFPFKVLIYCDELGNSIFMYIILPIMDDNLTCELQKQYCSGNLN